MKLVSLRHDIPGQFPDDESFNVLARQYIAARAHAQELGRRYTVAPRQSLTTQDGRTLQPGDEVRVTDFKHIRRYIPGESLFESSPWEQLEKMVLTGVCIEAEVPESTPPAAA